MMGWDVDFLQDAVDTCTNPSGEIEDCPLFTIQSLADAQACQIDIPADLASDNTAGPAASLPGSVAPFGDYMDVTMLETYNPALSFQPTSTEGLEGGFGAGTVVAQNAGATGDAAAAPVPTTPSSPAAGVAATTAVNAQIVANIHSDNVFVSSVASSSPVAAPPSPSPSPSSPSSVTTAPPSSPSGETHVNVISTQYITAGNMVTEILWEETIVYVTEDPETIVTTITTTPAAAVKPRFHNHLRRHRRGRE